jgi:hypothetical protein
MDRRNKVLTILSQCIATFEEQVILKEEMSDGPMANWRIDDGRLSLVP